MENITLEKVDIIRERLNVTYEKAKEALEICEGNVLDALIYIEKNQKVNDSSNKEFSNEKENKANMSIEELKEWFKEIIEKGNITRIKIKKDDNELIDIPVNAGIAAGIVALVIPPILAAGVIAAIATKITVEITNQDGTVEIVNKYVSEVAVNMKNKATDFADKVKTKVNEMTNDEIKDDKQEKETDSVYTYTVNFEDEKENSEK